MLLSLNNCLKIIFLTTLFSLRDQQLLPKKKHLVNVDALTGRYL